ncbi:NosD domain-containing protein [Coraliomargarita sp. W4R72]
MWTRYSQWTALLFWAAGLSAPMLAATASAAETLQARIDATAPGAVLELTAGIYRGPVTIEQAMTLRGLPGAVIDGGREGSVIRVRAPHVRIEGLTIRHSGLNLSKDEAGIHATGDSVSIIDNRIESCLHGIYLREVKGGTLRGNTIVGATGGDLEPIHDALTAGTPRLGGDAEFCAVALLNSNRRGNGIHLFSSSDLRIENNRVARTRDGIYFSFTDTCVATGNHVSDTRYGLHYMYSNENRFDHNYFDRNAAGAALMYSGGLMVENNDFSGNRGSRAYGMLLQSVDDSTIQNNLFADNTIGLYAENCQHNAFVGNRIMGNYIGLRMGGSSADNRVAQNQFGRNLHPAEFAGKADANQWHDSQYGNLWQLSQSPDLDGDGVGELAHREADFLGDMRRSFPLVGLLSGSPGLELLRFAQSRAKLPKLPTIEDPHPLTRTIAP